VNVLFLAHRLPLRPDKGDKIRAHNILKHLARRHAVWLGGLTDEGDVPASSDLLALVREIVSAPLDGSRIRAAVAAVAVGRPVTLAWFHRDELQRKIDRLVAEQRFDVVFCSCEPMGEYVLRPGPTRDALRDAIHIMDLMDVDSCKWAQYAERSGFPRRLVYAREARLLARYEARLAREFDALLVVSEQERGYLPDGVDPASVTAVSNGVDLEYFSPAYVSARSVPGPVVVFTGVMDYWPNVEGVLWFAANVWPAVVRAVPSARFYVVGSRPTPAVQKLTQQPGIEVTGFVDDVRDYVGAAAVCVAPLRIARGIQNKVLEAMSMGRAVVCTPQAYEGITAAPGRDLVVAASAEEMAEAIGQLILEPARAHALGRSARAHVERHHDWSVNLSTLDQLIQRQARA
jgi:sugar transferase (PEP-CTERM/EpsH1 system associated)